MVPRLWPLVYRSGVEISFAYAPFKWSNSASNNAGVTCIIIGLSTQSSSVKTYFTSDMRSETSSIGPYLIPNTSNLIVEKRFKPISDLPPMVKGNMPTDDWNLILSPDERNQILSSHPQAAIFVRRYGGSDEFINSIERYCLWIEDSEISLALSIAPVANRINRVKASRLKSQAPSTT